MRSVATQPSESSDAWVDPREIAEYSVLMPNGRLAGRSFASRAEAAAWARPEHGEEVIELNQICACDA